MYIESLLLKILFIRVMNPQKKSHHARRNSKLSADSEAENEESIFNRRKVSLMPLLTEADLRDIGHKDPEGVAQVFGDDVASRFLHPNVSSPPPYDTKDKMLRRKISPIVTPLPFETRDGSIPRFWIF